MIFLGNINGAWDLHRDIIVVYMIHDKEQWQQGEILISNNHGFYVDL